MTTESFLNVVLSRASVRMFKQDPIPPETIKRILEAGIRAPTAGGREAWFFMIVKSEEKRKQIHELLKKAHVMYATNVVRKPYSERAIIKWVKRMEAGMYMAPLYIAGYIDLREPYMREEYEDLERLMAHHSLAAAFENMILVAWSMGIGSVWLGVPLQMRDEFDKVLRPPKGLELAGMLALGYPAEKPVIRERRPLSEKVKEI